MGGRGGTFHGICTSVGGADASLEFRDTRVIVEGPFLAGLGAVSVAGHATCDREFGIHGSGGATGAQCLGGRDVAEPWGVPEGGN
jgi:hypothetical protein